MPDHIPKLSPDLKEAYLEEHIPYRLKGIGLFGAVCYHLLYNRAPAPAKLFVNDRLLIDASSSLAFTNPLVEIGALYCRAVLEFLGTKLKSRDRVPCLDTRDPYPENSPKNDVGIEHFGLDLLTVDDVIRAQSPEAMPTENEKACIVTIQTANKAVAHLTHSNPEVLLNDLYRCSVLVPWLVEHYLYIPLGRAMPDCRANVYKTTGS